MLNIFGIKFGEGNNLNVIHWTPCSTCHTLSNSQYDPIPLDLHNYHSPKHMYQIDGLESSLSQDIHVLLFFILEVKVLFIEIICKFEHKY